MVNLLDNTTGTVTLKGILMNRDDGELVIFKNIAKS